MAAASAVNLGFLTVLQEGASYLGGYLITNIWGRPLEFRLSTAVQPNRVQHILYAATLKPYICADLIGKTLVEKAGIGVQLIITDTEAVLDLRHRVEAPVLHAAGSAPPIAHPRFPNDAETAREILAQVEGLIDLAEPFLRIREAISEARKMGVTGRAA
jgi:hypothetical protein